MFIVRNTYMKLIHIPIDPNFSQILTKLLYLDYDNIIALRFIQSLQNPQSIEITYASVQLIIIWILSTELM